jgi:hypothetical protein
MADLLEDPSTSQLRKKLDSYLKAVEDGREFTLFNYNTPIGKIGQPSKMPKRFKVTAQKVSFTDVRGSSSLLRKSMMKAQAIVITKLVRGSDAVPRRGRRPARARDAKEIAAVWPLQEGATMTALLELGRQHSQLFQGLTAQITTLNNAVQPIAKKIEAIRLLDDEIAERRRVVDNLGKTARRIGMPPG